MPALPAGRIVQVPFAVAPSAAEQTSHPPPQVVSQQYPSTQPPAVLHTRQFEGTSQSALGSQAAPGALRSAQVLFAAQYRLLVQSASEAQLVGQFAEVPLQRYAVQAGLPGLPSG